MTQPPFTGNHHDSRLSSRARGLLSFLAVLCASLCLGGCAQLQAGLAGAADLSPSTLLSSRPAPDGVYLPSTTARVFGRCWNATYAEVSTWKTWRGGDHVPCTDEHTTYTYATEDLPDALVLEIDAANSERATLALQDDISDAIAEICGTEFGHLFPTLTERQTLVTWFSFLPSESDWEQGARWVRCDVAVYALTASADRLATTSEPQARAEDAAPASPSSAPELLVLPESVQELVTAVERRPADFEYCLDDDGAGRADGPRHSATAVTVSCRDDPLWTYLGWETLPEPRGAPFPGEEAVFDAAQAACDDASLLRGEGEHSGWIYYPGEEGWNEGSRIVQCWSTN
jgi:hypothetical protein